MNYDDEKFIRVYRNAQAAQRGTRLHDLAAECIRLGVKLPRSPKTLNMYVNDAIGFRMTPEQVVFYSINAFGTCDAISFRDNLLRIHDLKTGVSPSSMRQLEVYAAFFCLEYRVRPGEIGIELRIYKDDVIEFHEPDINDIGHIMDTTIRFDKRIEEMKGDV